MKFRCVDDTELPLFGLRKKIEGITRGKVYFGQPEALYGNRLVLIVYGDNGHWKIYGLERFEPQE